jgi:parvulin-like peptidyl-prolyl isomerase
VNAVFDRAGAGQRQVITPMQRHESAIRVLEMLQDQAILINAAKKQDIKVSNDDVRKEIDKRVKDESDRLGVSSLPSKTEQRTYESRIRSDIEAQRDDIRNELLTQKMADKLKANVALDSPGIKPQDIEVNARHILITWKGLKNADPKVTRTKAQAKALADKLAAEAKKNPAGFAALADQNTEDASGKGKGGDLGWFTKGQMVPAFDKAAFEAKPGQVVGPIESPFGYHVIKVEDRRVSQARANQEIQKFLDAEKKNQKLEIVAPDFKAAQAYDELMKVPAKDKKAQVAKRQTVIADYEAAAKARPTDPALFARLGSLYKDDGKTDKAIAAYEQAASLRGAPAEVHLALGDLYRQKKLKDKALDHYRTAGRLAGDNMMVHVMLQMAYHDMGQKELAQQQSEWLRNAQAQNQGQMPMTVPGG